MPTAKGKKSGGSAAAARKGAKKTQAKAKSRPKPLKQKKKGARARPTKRTAARKAKPARPSARKRASAKKAVAKAKKATPKKAGAFKKAAVKVGKSVVKTLTKVIASPPSRPARGVTPPAVSQKGKGAVGARPGKSVTPPVSASRPGVPQVVIPKPAKPPKPPKPARGGRRARTRIQSDGGPIANWLTPENRPRPSSFIPAPPRAESPSLVAAPPASSDRLVHPDHIERPQPGIRLYPVRVDIEQGGGRIFVVVNPERVTIRPGEGIEWDFRYLGGADAIVEEVVIEFPKSGAFSKTSFKSQKPGSARPHRQISGPATNAAAGREVQYLIRSLNLVKSEVAVGKATVVVSS